MDMPTFFCPESHDNLFRRIHSDLSGPERNTQRASALSLVLLSTKAMSSTESSLRSATTRVNASGASVNIASANSAEVGMRQPSGNSEIGEAASNPALTSIDDISMMANA